MKNLNRSIVSTAKYLILIIVAVLQIYPLYWLLTFSLKSNIEIFNTNPLGLPQEWMWQNFVEVFSRGNVGAYFLNSVIVTSASIVISTIVAAMASYAIARMSWRLSSKSLMLFLAGMMIPIHATLVPLFIVLKQSGLYNTYWALILPYVAFALPMAVYVFVGFFRTLPRELEEAACIDGMNIYGIFIKIMLPLIAPAIATVAIFTYLSCWNELMFAITFVSTESLKTLTAGIMGLVGRFSTKWGVVGAGLMIATIPTLLLYTLMSSQIQKSLTTGAIKG